MPLLIAAPAHEFTAVGAQDRSPALVTTAAPAPRSWLVGVVVACMVGSLFVLGATSRGIGVSPDSVQYFSVAKNTAEGRGLVTYAWEGEPQPLTHFPPAYPLTLSAGASITGSSEAFARWFNIVLFTLTIVVAVIITRRLAPASPWPVLAVAGLYATAYDMVAAHSMAWTEPLYLTLTLLWCVAVVQAIERGSLRLLLVASILAGLTATVRYIGVANVGALGLAVLLLWPAAWWRRFATAGTAGLIGITPFLIAILTAGATASAESPDGEVATVGNRQLGWHPPGLADVRMFTSVVAKWVSPLNDATILTGIWVLGIALLLAVVIAARVRSSRPGIGTRRSTYVRVMLIYTAVYFAVLLLSMTIADAQTELDYRLLLPLLGMSIILGVVWLEEASAESARVRRVARTLVVLVIIAGLARIVPWAADARSEGLALRRVDSADSQTVSRAAQLPAAARVYSNRPYFLRVQTGRMVHGLPRQRDPNSLLPNERYATETAAICSSASRRDTYIVLFPASVSEDPTANGPMAALHGGAAVGNGSQLIKVRPGCS